MQYNNIRWISRTAILLAISLVFQMGGFPQFITGPLVNTVLYLAAMRGILPPPLMPLIPFIALGNAVLVILFFWLKSRNNILGILIASAVKFLVLVSAVNLLVQVPSAIAQMMSFPQLITALTGGFIALLIVNIFKKTDIEFK